MRARTSTGSHISTRKMLPNMRARELDAGRAPPMHCAMLDLLEGVSRQSVLWGWGRYGELLKTALVPAPQHSNTPPIRVLAASSSLSPPRSSLDREKSSGPLLGLIVMNH
jgi:hypothetical protein